MKQGAKQNSMEYRNHVSDKESELFEKVIDRQQEEINYLKGIIDALKK